jgi:S-adenosylmethionine decarboxylase
MESARSGRPPAALQNRHLGRHVIAEFWGAIGIRDSEFAGQALVDAAEASGATVIDCQKHQFEKGCGVTVVVLLMESHISLHSWPEHDYAAIDVFTCGVSDPHLAIDHLRRVMLPTRVELHELLRGISG